MKVSSDVEIAIEKVTEYLLKKRDDSDKSQYLSMAGYTIDNSPQLIEDLKAQMLVHDAILIDSNIYGDKYQIRGILKGPNGKKLDVISVWMNESTTGQWKFITLFPARRKG